IEADHLTLDLVQSRLAAVTGIPVDSQRLTTAGGLLCSDGVFGAAAATSGTHAAQRVVYLSLGMRVAGGKGGFGSELRKMGARLAARKATNFDSCRDLNGRRLKTAKRAKAYVVGWSQWMADGVG
ncbi:telomere stability and silencing-domain-containing protein, partial [Syncephalis pseudoplumigaleata]